MPRVMMWNIQLFGSTRFDGNVFARNVRRRFIAATIRRAQADVVIVQEALRTCGPELVALCAELNVGAPIWHFDCIPGALINAEASPSAADLGWRQIAHYEGYAVIYRNGADGNPSLDTIAGAPSFGMDNPNFEVPAGGVNHFINIETIGRWPEFFWNSDLSVNFNWDNVFDAAQEVQNNQILGFPRPGNIGPVVQGNNDLMQQITEVRRPCHVRVRSGDQFVNVVCYHAPSHFSSAVVGTLMAFGCGSLQYPGRKLLGGDFNLTARPQSLRGVMMMMEQEQLGYIGTLQIQADGNPGNPRTMIHSLPTPGWGEGEGWYNGTLRPYGSSPRDFGMDSPGAEVRPWRMDTVDAMVLDLPTLVSPYRLILTWITANGWLQTHMAGVAWFTDVVFEVATRRAVVNALIDDLAQPGIQQEYPPGTNRTTAVLILMEYFMSDHQPICFIL